MRIAHSGSIDPQSFQACLLPRNDPPGHWSAAVPGALKLHESGMFAQPMAISESKIRAERVLVQAGTSTT